MTNNPSIIPILSPVLFKSHDAGIAIITYAT